MRVHHAVGKSRPENHHKVYLPFSEQICGFFLTADFPFSYEIIVGIELLGQHFGIDITAFINNSHTDVFYIVFNYKSW